jgi:hypothetical protein
MNAMRNFLILACVVVALGTTPNVRADFTFGEPVKFPYGGDLDCFSSDGLEMYIAQYLSADNADLYVLRRASVDDDWGPPVSLGPAVNSSQIDEGASISADGLTLYFHSTRPGGFGRYDIYVTTRASRSAAWGPAVNVGPTINSSGADSCPWISTNGLELYFQSNPRSGGYGGLDIYVARRATTDAPWGEPENLGPPVNSVYDEDIPCLSADGLVLFFCDWWGGGTPRPGGYGSADMWMTRRASLSGPWQTPVNLGPKVNGPGLEALPRISPDGCTLYFSGIRGGVGDVWQAPILPVVDFNGDQIVDIKDLLRLIESWGKDDPSVDMGPMPWGDGKVDAKDLEVVMSYWGQDVNDPGLVASWRLDEASGMIAADSAGTNDGTLIGNPTWQPAGGKIKGALQFDGKDDCVTTSSPLNPSEGPFSVFAWVKGGAPGQVVVSQEKGGNWLMLDSATGALMTDSQRSGRLAKALCSDMAITDGAWHRVGLVWDSKSRMLYVDGIEVAKDSPSSGLQSSVGGLQIGTGTALAPGTFWSGLIDDVRIYSRAVKP